MSRHVPPRTTDRCRARRRLTLLLAPLLALAAPRAEGQDYWELAPYRVHLLVAVERSAVLTPRAADQLRQQVAARLDAVIGPAWELQLSAAPAELAGKILDASAAIAEADLAEEHLQGDKVFTLGVAARPDGYRLVAREFDVATRSGGHARTSWQPPGGPLSWGIVRAVVAVFAPLARVTAGQGNEATISLRAASLPRPVGGLPLVAAGDVFRPIVRRLGRDGNPQEGGIQPIPWTFLTVGAVDGPRATCRVTTGLRNPLAVRRRGRTDVVAIAVRPDSRPTRLRLESRVEPPRPLAGYAIYDRAQPARPLGRTARDGSLFIPPGPESLRELIVKNGSELLARLPVVPGLQRELTAQVVDDDVRLQVEGRLASVRENLIDLVARRQVLMARAGGAIKSGNAEAAERLLDELKRLPTREQFAQRLDQLVQQSTSDDRGVQAKIERLVGETRKLLAGYLDPAPIDELQGTFNALKSGGA